MVYAQFRQKSRHRLCGRRLVYLGKVGRQLDRVQRLDSASVRGALGETCGQTGIEGMSTPRDRAGRSGTINLERIGLRFELQEL